MPYGIEILDKQSVKLEVSFWMARKWISTKRSIKDIRAGRIENIQAKFCITETASFQQFCKAVLYTPLNLYWSSTNKWEVTDKMY